MPRSTDGLLKCAGAKKTNRPEKGQQVAFACAVGAEQNSHVTKFDGLVPEGLVAFKRYPAQPVRSRRVAGLFQQPVAFSHRTHNTLA